MSNNPVLYAYGDQKTTQQATINSDGVTIPPLAVSTSEPAYRMLPQFAFTDKAANGNSVSLAVASIKDKSDDIDSFIALPLGNIDPQPMTEDITPWSGISVGLGNWPLTQALASIGGGKYAPSGDHSQIITSGTIPGSALTYGDLTKISDRDYTTGLNIRFINNNQSSNVMAFAFKFQLPPVADSFGNALFDWDKVYLGIRAKTASPGQHYTSIAFGVQRPFVNAAALIDANNKQHDSSHYIPANNSALIYDDIPDAYYVTSPATSDINFRTKTTELSSTAPVNGYFGYQNYELSALTQSNYMSYRKAAFIIFAQSLIGTTGSPSATGNFVAGNLQQVSSGSASYFSAGDYVYIYNSDAGTWQGPIQVSSIGSGLINFPSNVGNGTSNIVFVTKAYIDFSLYELCLIFHKTQSVSDAVYSPMRGRIFNATWGGRRTATDLITRPADLLEHFCRLQNWDYPSTARQAGKNYAANPKINTAITLGGFEFSSLYSSPITPSFQIHDLRESDIISIKREICRTSFLASYRDGAGNECVLPLDFDPYGSSPLITAGFPTGYGLPFSIALDDIYGEAGPIEEADAQYCWSQPVVNYLYDYGAGKYQRAVGIADATASVFSPSCVVGFSAADMGTAAYSYNDGIAKTYWQACRNLYLRYGNLEAPSGDAADRPYLRQYYDATWYLAHWIDWMSRRQKRIEVPCNYAKGAEIYTGMIGQCWMYDCKFVPAGDSRGSIVYAIVERIRKSKNNDQTVFTLLLIDPA